MTYDTRAAKSPVWTWVCSCSSFGLLLTLIAMAFHIRLALGRWPEFGEDPGTFLFDAHMLLFGTIAFFALYAAAPLWLVFLCYARYRLSLGMHLAQVLLFALGWLLIFVAGKYDPTPFTYWFLD